MKDGGVGAWWVFQCLINEYDVVLSSKGRVCKGLVELQGCSGSVSELARRSGLTVNMAYQIVQELFDLQVLDVRRMGNRLEVFFSGSVVGSAGVFKKKMTGD